MPGRGQRLVGLQANLSRALYKECLTTSERDAMVVTCTQEASTSRIRNLFHHGNRHSQEMELHVPPLPLLADQQDHIATLVQQVELWRSLLLLLVPAFGPSMGGHPTCGPIILAVLTVPSRESPLILRKITWPFGCLGNPSLDTGARQPSTPSMSTWKGTKA